MKTYQQIVRQSRRQDRIFRVIGVLCTALGLVTLTALLADLMIDGFARIDWQFMTNFPSRHFEKAGILSAWVGSLLVILVMAIAAIPLGIAAGVYLEEYAPRNWFTELLEINVANLAGVPSIIFGLMALGIFVYFFGFGHSVLTAGLTLGCLVLPIVIVATREALRTIPTSIREASYGLGATKWQTVWFHLLPYSIGGVATGVIVALSRALGETAPLVTIGALTFIAFLPDPPLAPSPPYISFEWLLSPFTVLPIQMFNWISRPQQEFHVNAAAAGLVLIALTLLLNSMAIVIRYRMRKKIKW